MDSYDIAHASAERTAGACVALGIEPTITADDELANFLCSHSVTSSIRSLRTLGVEDSVVAVALFAGLRTLLRHQPNRESWAALLVDTAAELCVHG